MKKLLPRALILTMPLMIGALTSLWLDKILLTIEKMHSPDWLEQDSLGPLHIAQPFHEFMAVLDKNVESSPNPLTHTHTNTQPPVAKSQK